MKSTGILFFSLAGICLLAACGDDDTAENTGPVDRGDTSGADTTENDSSGSDAVDDSGADATPDSPSEDTAGADTSEGLEPLLAAYSGGECPTFEAGVASILTGGTERELEIYTPDDPTGKPVVFFFYGTGGSGQDYSSLQSFADAFDLTVIVPHAIGTLTFEWPIMSGENPDKEALFFDDMLACINANFAVDTTRLYATGFSAGALWTTYLSMTRSDVLAAVAVFSGGTGQLVHGYEKPVYPIPVLGAWGGDADVFAGFVNFSQFMDEYLNNIAGDGSYVIGCDHGLGHTVPDDGFSWGFEFLIAHQFGVESPYIADGLPNYFPNYCSEF